MNVVPSFRNENEHCSEYDVANIGEKVVEISEVHDEMVGISASEIVVTHILITCCDHHLFKYPLAI